MFASALISGYLLTRSGWPLVLCLVISVLVGLIFGAINGYLVAYWDVAPFITSMGLMQIAKGAGSVFNTLSQ